MDKDKIIAFMIHLGDVPFDTPDILKALQEYNIGKYIIAKEEKPYVHWHVCVEMSVPMYNNFIAQYVSISSKSKGLWKLRGRIKDGKPKQYGKVTNIKKPDKMIAYTLKQGCYISNVDEEWLKPYKEMSYTKDTQSDVDREIRDKLRHWIDNVYYSDHFKPVHDEHLKKAIIRFLLLEKIRIRTASQIDGYFKYLRQFSNHDYIRKNCELYFYELLYNNY